MLDEAKRNVIFSNLKAFTMLLVVAGHVCVFFAGFGVINFPIHPFFAFLVRLIYSFHMPLYFFISGCIYEICVENGRYENSRIFVRKKVRRLIIPYLFWGVTVVAPTMVRLDFTDLTWPEYCLSGILLGKNTRHLWFLISLFTMFLLADTVRRLTRVRKLQDSALTVLVLLGIPAALLYHHAWNLFALPSTARCFIYFTGGILLEKNRRICKISPSAGKALFSIGTAVLFFWSLTGDMNSPWQRLAVGVIGIAVVFLLAVNLSNRPQKSGKFLSLIKRDSFGIYLAHPMIIYVIMYSYNKAAITLSPFIVVPAVFLIALSLSVAVTELIRKLQLGVIIGE